MQVQFMLLTVLPGHAASHWTLAGPAAHLVAHPVLARASLGIPDTLAIFVVALVVFGPKRLPEIGKQIGKLVFEFRRASNDFKLQIEEELRLAEQQDRQKVLDMQAAAVQPATPVALSADSTTSAVAAEAVPADGSGAMTGSEPQPPDRQSGFGAMNGTNLTGKLSGSSPESAPSEALTVQPPSTGTLVSALPPNHAARNVMTAIPPAQAPPQAVNGPAPTDEPFSTDQQSPAETSAANHE